MELGLSFYSISSGDGAQVVMLGGRCLDLPSGWSHSVGSWRVPHWCLWYSHCLYHRWAGGVWAHIDGSQQHPWQLPTVTNTSTCKHSVRDSFPPWTVIYVAVLVCKSFASATWQFILPGFASQDICSSKQRGYLVFRGKPWKAISTRPRWHPRLPDYEKDKERRDTEPTHS